MKYFIFRNYTVEPFFKELDAIFSGYEDISFMDIKADRYIWFYLAPYKTDNEIIAKEIENYGNLLEFTLTAIDANKLMLAFTMQPIFHINYQTKENSINSAIITYNQKIKDLSEQHRNLKIIDFYNFISCYSQEYLIDWKFFFLSQMPLNPKLATEFGSWFKKQIETIELKRKKCIVLDLDNTLWSGILGEDGAEGIQIGETYQGNCFLFFQEYLLELAKNGVILSVCSKNNEQDVLDLWKSNPNIKIRGEQLAAWRINWQNKADNIREIAEELNIGLDSLVFIDDNPSERELVKQLLPQVTVPDFPEKPYLLPEFVKMLTDKYFTIYELTKEDAEKTQQYKENALRKQFENKFTNLDDYLRSLEIELSIEALNEMNIARLAQLTQKTNQFNLTTQRYTEADIRNLADNGAWIFGLRVKDRFGDNGLTGLIIITNYETTFGVSQLRITINTFLLSCRILGKGIEDAFLQYVLMKLKNKGVKTIEAKFIKTLKNSQVENFYDKNNFEIVNSTGDEKNYFLHIYDINYSLSDIYKITEV